MLKEWRKFKGWETLEFFLKNPNSKIHIKGLARTLKISPQTSERYLNLYKKQGILKEEKVANSRLFSLNNEDFLVKELKKTWFLLTLKQSGFIKKLLEKNKDITTLAVYGAYASGEFTEHSDIDVLVVTQQKKVDMDAFRKLEEDADKKVDVTKLTLGEWRNLVKKGDSFAGSVLRNNILLEGGRL